MNEPDVNLRELLDRAAGEPPRWVNLDAVHRHAIRRRAARAGFASLAIIVAAALGATLSSGALGTGRPGPAPGAHQNHAGPPPFYIAADSGPKFGERSLVVRDTATGRITAVIRDPKPGLNCGGSFAAAGTDTFFMTCTIWKLTGSGSHSRVKHIESLIYRFQLTGSGRISGLSLVKDADLNGLLTTGLAASADGSTIAVEVMRPDPLTKQLYTNGVISGIYLINTKTGQKAFWHTGPYRHGAIQYAYGSDLSLTRDGSELVVAESRCPRTRYLVNCNGTEGLQVRAYSPAGRGGSLEKGQILLTRSDLSPARTNLSGTFVSPDGSALTSILNTCAFRKKCTWRVATISVATHRITHVLFENQQGTQFNAIAEQIYCIDPSGRYVIFGLAERQKGTAGWIRDGKLVKIPPAGDLNITYQAW